MPKPAAWWLGACAAVALTGCTATQFQDCGAHRVPEAEALFERYLASRGGQTVLESLQVVERIGWIAVDAGPGGLLAGSYHTCIRYPDRVAIEIDAGRWQLAQALRADGAVECGVGFQGCVPAGDELARELVDTAAHANKDLLQDATAWWAAEVSPSKDGQAWRLTIEGGRWAELDPAGSLLALGTGDRWRRLGQWRDVDGVTFPHRLEDYQIQTDGSEWRSTVHLSEIRLAKTSSPWCIERFGAQ